jgi:type I restriction enzyme S subunit
MLLSNLNLLATAPGGVARLRELILTLAVQGKLLPQNPQDEPASMLLKKIRAEKDRLIAEGKIKRDKQLAAITEEEKPFDVPVGWEWVRLNALLQKIGAGSTPLGGREVYVSSGVKFLRSQNVWDEGLHLQGVAFIKPETHAKMAGTVVVANDLLFNITGASIGRCALVPHDFDEANVSQHVTIVRAVLPAVNAFLHKVLVSQHVQQAVMDVQVGVSREGLSIAKLGHFLIPVPPLAEQTRIVTRVEELMRLCDALETKGQLAAAQHTQLVSTLLGTLTDSATPDALAENWQRIVSHFDLLLDRPQAVDALEQTILQLAVRGLLVPQDPTDEPARVLLQTIRTEKDCLIAAGQLKRDKPMPPIADDEQPFALPLGWEWTRLGTLGELFDYGTSQKAVEDHSAVPILRMGNIQGGRVVMYNLKYLFDQDGDLPSLLLRKGDLLFNRTNSYELVGKTGLFEGFSRDVTFASYLIRIRLVESFGVPEYINMYMNSHDCRENEIEPDLTQQTGQANYNGTKLKNIRVPLPPLAEQSRIVTRVESLRRLCADLRQRLSASQSTQAQLAEALVSNVAA